MSSGEDDYNDDDNTGGMSGSASKKRRVQRACDICRRKKIRCDGGQMPGNKCSNCIAYNYECTYVEAAKKRGPPKGYVEGLENRLEKMERLLSKLAPDGDYAQELEGSGDTHWFPAMEAAPSRSNNITSSALSVSHGIIKPTVEDDGLAPPESDSEDDFTTVNISENLRKRLAMDPMHYRFFGKSSGVMLIQTAIDMKKEFIGNDQNPTKKVMIGSKRPEFWNVRPWELANIPIERVNYIFPDNDLMTTLIDLYFVHTNLIYPLLHRPTFEKGVAEGLHQRSIGFGGTVLLVCAIGSRYSSDPRVMLPDANSDHSSGWKYFDQVQTIRRSQLAPPSLYDLQIYCLSVMFLQGGSAPQACWTMVGIGIRLAQDVGAHRRKMYTSSKPTIDDELWKRAFWGLVTLDRYISSSLGRPCAIQDEDFDLDLPIEVDDEYWEDPDPDKAFVQPPGKPSIVSFFVSYLKLNQILAFALRTIYSINKSKVLLGFVGQKWEQHIVAELDSALNKWIDAVPDQLRWDPNREDPRFFNQSAFLHASFYHLQILIHRPFIPSPRKPSPLSFPSLAICTNAARSCSHVVDTQRRRTNLPMPVLQVAVFTAGIVLLLNIWGGKKSGLNTDATKELADVHKCMAVLKLGEARWHSAGRLWDVLCELSSVGDFPLPQPSPAGSNKRERDSDSPSSSGAAPTPASTSVHEGPRNIAGSRRVASNTNTSASSSSQAQSPPFSLPMYSDDLGRLPLHNENPIAEPDNFWFSTLGNSGAALPEQIASTSMAHQGAMPPQHFSMDHTMFFDQMSGDLPSSFTQNSTTGHGHYSGVQNLHTMGVETTMQPQLPQDQALMDNDTIAMWSNAPTGFELDDWGTYMSELSHGQHHPPGQHGH